MRAAVYKGKQSLKVEEIPTPEPGPGELLVKIKYSAICGTDVHAFLYDVPRPGTVMGHEFSGTVVRLGPGVSSWRVGDRVVGGGGAPPPGQAPALLSDPRYNFRTMGYGPSADRAYAEYMLMKEWRPIPIPDGVGDLEAALCEPCGVAVRAVRRSDLRLGDSVAVLGAGPIGMLVVQAARAAGASTVIVSEPAPARKEAATKVGADVVVDPTEGDVVSEIESLTGGLGPDIVFDCAGVSSTLDQAFNMVRHSGQVVLVAVPWEPLPIMPVDWMAREIRMQTTFGGRPEDYRIALDLMRSGKVTIGAMASEAEFIPLEKIQSAFEALAEPSTQLQMVVAF